MSGLRRKTEGEVKIIILIQIPNFLCGRVKSERRRREVSGVEGKPTRERERRESVEQMKDLIENRRRITIWSMMEGKRY